MSHNKAVTNTIEPIVRRICVFAFALIFVLFAGGSASAFCGFYVGGADAELFNNATSVVMMRDANTTVLSMQNNYQGPPSDFALVIPVPQILEEENVRTLPDAVFRAVDAMGAPRLVEYWEQDPCAPPALALDAMAMGGAATRGAGFGSGRTQEAVRIEAEFSVGEYDIVILSADDSGALDTWLRQNDYSIPDGAAPYLRPYVESGMYFFVAKVDAERVTFGDDGQAMLSPLRFHYESDSFTLPIRLGLINANDKQDLIVSIIGRGQRYEAANYENVTIPTNLELTPDAKDRFGEFYAALFDRTLEQAPRTVVTEYSWAADTCDPCPGASLRAQDFLTLGADVLGGGRRGWVLTRLHTRYAAGDVGEDLVFRETGGIVGGREHRPQGESRQGATASQVNNFQGRYIIRHPWEGPVECESPVRGRWGGPIGSARGRASASTVSASSLAFAPRGQLDLASMLTGDVEQLGLQASGQRGVPSAGPPVADTAPETDSDPEEAPDNAAPAESESGGEAAQSQEEETPKRGCSQSAGSMGAGFLLPALFFVRRRRSRSA